jgi:metal-responsive CopG/Arc/MetJ family transcriptional regulator
METVQIVIDKELLQAADTAARHTKRNRSALVRDAIREHLRKLEVHAMEERERQGYLGKPQNPADFQAWEKEAVWPDE